MLLRTCKWILAAGLEILIHLIIQITTMACIYTILSLLLFPIIFHLRETFIKWSRNWSDTCKVVIFILLKIITCWKSIRVCSKDADIINFWRKRDLLLLHLGRSELIIIYLVNVLIKSTLIFLIRRRNITTTWITINMIITLFFIKWNVG